MGKSSNHMLECILHHFLLSGYFRSRAKTKIYTVAELYVISEI